MCACQSRSSPFNVGAKLGSRRVFRSNWVIKTARLSFHLFHRNVFEREQETFLPVFWVLQCAFYHLGSE